MRKRYIIPGDPEYTCKDSKVILMSAQTLQAPLENVFSMPRSGIGTLGIYFLAFIGIILYYRCNNYESSKMHF